MKAQFKVSVRMDMVGTPLQISCCLQEASDTLPRELEVHLDAQGGWVDAKQLVEALRAIVRVTERELA